MLSDKEQLRDISSIGLKTVISELPLGSNELVANVCKKITGKLSSAIEKVKLNFQRLCNCEFVQNNKYFSKRFTARRRICAIGGS